MSSIFEQFREAPGHLGSAVSNLGHAVTDPIMGGVHAAESVGSGYLHGAQSLLSGGMHAGSDLAHDVAGGFSHGMSDIMHGHLGSGLLDMGGGLLSGLGHAGADLGGGLLSAGKDVLGGFGGGIADLAKGGMSGLGGLFGGAKDLWSASKPLRTANTAFGDAKQGWDLLHGKVLGVKVALPASLFRRKILGKKAAGRTSYFLPFLRSAIPSSSAFKPRSNRRS